MPTLTRHNPSSPSVSLEKGAYRLKRKSNFDAMSYKSPPDTNSEGRILKKRAKDPVALHLGALICLLALMCISSFGFAYYLLSTRSDSLIWSLLSSSDLAVSTEVAHNAVERSLPASYPDDNNDKYLAYLHHSGFNNQRISLENAFVLAHLLNRSLIVPPVRLGKPPISYYNSEKLQLMLSLDGKEGLDHCLHFKHTSSPECLDYHLWTYVSWTSLVNLEGLGRELGVKTIERWDMTSNWFEKTLNISTTLNSTDILYYFDAEPRQYAFTDSDDLVDQRYKNYNATIAVSSLQAPHRILHLGTVFGTTRLRMTTQKARSALRVVRERMMFTNPLLFGAARSISEELGSNYIGVHLRIGDGIFESNAQSNVRQVWWAILRDMLSLDERTVTAIEENLDEYKHVIGSEPGEPPLPYFNITALRIPGRIPSLSLVPRKLAKRCYKSSQLPPVPQIPTTPIFISTDAAEPAKHPLLSRFLQTFPCVFFLSDFQHHLSSIDIVNDHDGVRLQPFLADFVDAMVASMGSRVIGTPKSTFSRFIEDVLWRKYHGWKIISRGKS